MGRVALVTGGTRGIGQAISIALKEEDYGVVASYAGNDEAAAKFNDEAGIPVYKFDVSDFDATADAIGQIKADLGPIEVLINNAGITWDKPLHKMEKKTWDAVINTNLSGLFNMCRNVIDDMRDAGFGRIISISSINGQKGQFGQTNYAAAKAGELGFTKALALETASKGITVNAIAPGYIATEMVMAVPETVMNDVILPAIPIGRLGQAKEIARCVVFLASDDARLITGSTITANGGQYMV